MSLQVQIFKTKKLDKTLISFQFFIRLKKYCPYSILEKSQRYATNVVSAEFFKTFNLSIMPHNLVLVLLFYNILICHDKSLNRILNTNTCSTLKGLFMKMIVRFAYKILFCNKFYN